MKRGGNYIKDESIVVSLVGPFFFFTISKADHHVFVLFACA